MTEDKPQKQASLGRTFGLVAVLTVLSKIAGLARDIVVAQAYGTGVIADAYNYAYMLTGNVLILFGGLGGPFHSSTVAILTPRKDDRNSGLLMCQVVAITFLALLVVTALVFLLAPQAVALMQHSYKGGDTARFAEQTLLQLKIMLPLIVIAGLVGITYGVLNVYNEVFWPSLSPAIASLAIIVALEFFPDLSSGIPLAAGTLAGAAGQFLAQLPGLFKLKLNWALPLKPQSGLSDYSAMIWPAIFSTSVGQLTVYVDGAFALVLGTGGWTAIVNSNRLIQLPLGVLLTAMLVPMLPRFTQLAADNRPEDLKEELRRSLRFLWFLCLPLSAVLLTIPGPIVRVLFQRGSFDAQSTALVTTALLFIVPSIFFYVARDLMTRVFYALQDSKTPYHVALMAIFVKFLLDYLFVLVLKLGVAGISLATTLITVFNLTLLAIFLRKKIGNLGTMSLLGPLAIMFLSSCLCAAVTLGTHHLIAGSLPGSGLVRQLVAVGTASVAGLLAYAACCLTFSLQEPLMLARRFPITRRFFANNDSLK